MSQIKADGALQCEFDCLFHRNRRLVNLSIINDCIVVGRPVNSLWSINIMQVALKN